MAPITLGASAVAFTVSILSLTAQRSASTRLLLFLCIATCNAFAVAHTDNFTSEIYYNWWWTLLLFQVTAYMGFLYRLDQDRLGIPEQAPFAKRLRHAWILFWNWRGIGTSWQISTVPVERILFVRFERPTTRKRFLIIRLTNILIMYFGLCLWYDPINTPPGGLQRGDFLESKEPYFRRLNELTMHENCVRLYFVVQHVYPSWIAYNLTHACISVIAVLLGDRPEDWPPFFGSISEAYSLTRYWRYFWHGSIRRSFSSTSAVLLQNVIGLHQNSELYPYAMPFMTFFLSAIMHSTAEKHWVTWRVTQATLWWWSLQAPVVLVEHWFQGFYLRNKHKIEKSIGARVKPEVEMTLGYVWVFLFMWWTVPRLEYVKMREL